MVTRWASVLTPALLTSDIEPAVLPHDGRDDRLDLHRVGDIEGHRLAVGGGRGRFPGCGQVHVGVDDVAAVDGEQIGDRLADAARGARDQGDPMGEVTFMLPSPPTKTNRRTATHPHAR